MSTTIKRVQFGASMWVPRPDPPRAIMPIVVTVAGFDTSDLIVDLSIWLSKILGWAELYQTIMLQITPQTDPAALARRPDTAGPLAVATPTTRPATGKPPAWSAHYSAGATAERGAVAKYL